MSDNVLPMNPDGQSPSPPVPGGGSGGGDELRDRVTRLEARMENVATKTDLARIEERTANMATQNDISKMQMTIVKASFGVGITIIMAAIALYAAIKA